MYAFYGRVSEERKIERAKVYALEEPSKEKQEEPFSFEKNKENQEEPYKENQEGIHYPKR
jgi:hypothetical protein